MDWLKGFWTPITQAKMKAITAVTRIKPPTLASLESFINDPREPIRGSGEEPGEDISQDEIQRDDGDGRGDDRVGGRRSDALRPALAPEAIGAGDDRDHGAINDALD